MRALLTAATLLAVALSASAQDRFDRGERRGPGFRGPDRAPAVGTKIPKVSAETPDGEETVELNKPERLTVLVFGSHT